MGASSLQPSTPAREAVSHLFAEHAERLFTLGLKMCGDPDEAEDLVQETFIRAYQSWAGFRGDSAPGTWLYTIAARVCQRMHRRRAGQPDRLESLTRLLPSGDESADIPDEQRDPLEETEQREVTDVVRSAVSSLDARYRLPLTLKDLLGLSTDEVGEVLSLKPSTVRSRIHRARLLLARELRRRMATGYQGKSADEALCLDLLHIRRSAPLSGNPSPISDDELCDRCGALLSSLDLAADACLDDGAVSRRLRAVLDRVTSTPLDSA